MYYQVPDDSGSAQPIISSRSFKVGVALIGASCLVFIFTMVSPPVLHGTTEGQSTSLASMPSALRFPQIAKVVRPAPGFLRSPQIAKERNSALPKGRGSVVASAHVPDQSSEEDAKAPVVTKMTPRRSILTAMAAAVAFNLGADSAKAAPATIGIDQLPPKIKMLQMIGSWDLNKDGRIDRPEFEKGMKDYVPHELTPAQLDNAWNRITEVEKYRRANDPSFIGNKMTEEDKQRPQPNQPIPLATSRVESPIPKASGGFFKYPSEQQAYNAMLRKGKDPDINRAKDFVSTHNEMNDRGWAQVLRYESVTHPDLPSKDVKLKKFNGDYAGRPKGSFDRHHWIINRCEGAEMTYVLDYFDLKKFDESTMPYSNDEIEIRVQPDPDDPLAKVETQRFEKAVGKSFTSTRDS